MKLKFIGILVIMFVCFNAASGQKHLLAKADRYYYQDAYAYAIDYYIEYLSSTNDMEVYMKLADCYRFTNMTVDAERIYSLIVKSPEAKPIHSMYLAKMLMSNQKYDEAKKWIIHYIKAVPNDREARVFLKACEDSEFLNAADSANFKLYNLNINSCESDFGAAFYKSGIVFSSANAELTKSKKKFGWNKEPYLNMYYSAEGFEEKFAEPVPFSENLNTRFHEGPVSFNKDKNLMYYTSNNFIRGKSSLSTTGVNKLNIYTSRLQENKWTDAELFEINNFEYSFGHPSISPDGKLLIFISDMPGGFGGTDLYMSRKLGFKWTKPVNMGIHINTSGDEMFPFMHEDGSLYFSSDGHYGIGGLDIYVTRFDGYHWEEPKNLKPPFNSSQDDFSFTIDKNHQQGFFSSNREGGKGSDDIYHFVKNFDALKTLTGRTISAITKNPVPNVNIIMQDYFDYEQSVITDDKGYFEFMIEPDNNYNLTVNRQGYHTKTVLYFSSEYIDMETPYLEIQLEEAIWFKLEGKVSDAESSSAITGVDVVLKNITYNISVTQFTEDDGQFIFDLDPESNYIIELSKDGYFTEIIDDLSTFGKYESEIIQYDIVLGMQKLALNEAIELKDIYYSVNSAVLNRRAQKECDKLVRLLKNNPHITIELSSHTDSRASDHYNLELSQKRANSVAKYLSQKGIEKSRVIPKGYGETRLKNRCSNGVPCPESLHQQNRRTEFKVMLNH
jgi:outer membrane protein OmpA-like peptidoglycan-associated protein